MKQYIRILSFITLLLTSLNSYAQSQGDGWNCFAVLAGKATTIDNSVLLAHNEDDSGEQMINIYNVPANKEKGTNKYIWVEFPGMAVADGFLNEYGVAVVSDACNSREDREDFTDGGVLYQVRESVAKYAKSARHAVEIIGKIVTEKGYTGSGRTYVVADCNQGWVCSVVKGRHWIAQRVPDDMVMSIPNYYTIGEIDLSDTSNFLGSPDIISYAQERGWYNPEKDGKFIFKKVYSNPGTYSS
ncbi:MAG: C69 family dipeptidase, partial [Bacteroidales bacterium]|nr:C69 family dipeptidase [Bacteroidales bacterium]